MGSIRFAEPQWLWLLVAPALVLCLWVRELVVRRRDVGRIVRAQQLPMRHRFSAWGDAPSLLCLVLAAALLIGALAKPGLVVSLVERGGVDVVVLLDGSASMHVRDVPGDRWRRSIRFLRVLGDSLRWDSDRIAMTLFAHIAAPQVRLTTDPNTYLFFLDHLAEQSPFPIEDESSWDTNIELGVSWGVRQIARDAELNGPSKNATIFVLVTDGQAWSGTVEQSLKLVREREMPVEVVGAGTVGGGVIPEPPVAATAKAKTGAKAPAAEDDADAEAAPRGPVYSALDRASLTRIANTAGGRYLELDRDSDVNLANLIVGDARRRSVSLPAEPRMQGLYWQLLFAAGCAAAAGIVLLRDRTELWLYGIGGAVALAAVAGFLR